MKTKVVCATAFFLLNIYFVAAASSRSGDIAGCIGPSLNNLTEEVEQTISLVREAVSVVNETVSSLKDCINSAGSSASGSPSSASISTCLMILYSEVAPEVQDVIQKYKTVIPALEKQIDKISNCLDGPPAS